MEYRYKIKYPLFLFIKHINVPRCLHERVIYKIRGYHVRLKSIPLSPIYVNEGEISYSLSTSRSFYNDL